MEYRVSAPNGDYTGESAGIPFANGIGYTTDEERVNWFRRKGYGVELLPGQDFILEEKKIGTVQDETITITDPDVVCDAMEALPAERNAQQLKIQEELETILKTVGKMKTDELITYAVERNIDLNDCGTNDLRRERIAASLTQIAQDAQEEASRS